MRRPTLAAAAAAGLYVAIALVLVGAPRVGCSGQEGAVSPSALVSRPVERLSCFVHYDGSEYVKIAERGYWYVPGEQSPIVWFPAYPMAMRAAAGLFGGPAGAGAAITFASGLVATLLLWRWLGRRVPDARAQWLSLAIWLLYPYATYLYGVVYADAFLVVFVIGAFLLVERRSYLLAAVAGALATATRPTAVVLVPALVLLALERDGVLGSDPEATGWRAVVAWPRRLERSSLRPRVLAPALSILGLLGYVGWLGARFGAPLSFATNESAFFPGDLPFTKSRFVNTLLQPSAQPGVWITLVAQGCIALGTLFLAPRVARRFGFAYGLFTALLVLLPTATSPDFMGLGRYLLPAFPTAAVVGEWLAERWPERRGLAVGWLVLSALALVWFATFFARGSYLA